MPTFEQLPPNIVFKDFKFDTKYNSEDSVFETKILFDLFDINTNEKILPVLGLGFENNFHFDLKVHSSITTLEEENFPRNIDLGQLD
jgi:hypothetical protein